MNNKIVEILLVEDNLGDIRLTQEAFAESSFHVNLNYVMDGEETIKYLRKEDKYATAVTPDLILLDLNLPRWDGKEVLRIIKNDVKLKHIPVVVLSTSVAERDIQESYNLHANCYLSKPIDFEQFFDLIKKIEEFWLSAVILPAAD